MPEYIVVLDSLNGHKKKTVRVYLENNGQHRQIEQNVARDFDVEGYLAENFNQVWDISIPLDSDTWEIAFETQLDDLYRDVVRAAVREAINPSATLLSVTTAMETVILSSDKAVEYGRLKTLATGASAVQRDLFFNIIGFLVVSKFIGK